MKQYKSTVNTGTHITKTPTHYKTHTYTQTLRNPYIHTPHITKQVKTAELQYVFET